MATLVPQSATLPPRPTLTRSRSRRVAEAAVNLTRSALARTRSQRSPVTPSFTTSGASSRSSSPPTEKPAISRSTSSVSRSASILSRRKDSVNTPLLVVSGEINDFSEPILNSKSRHSEYQSIDGLLTAPNAAAGNFLHPVDHYPRSWESQEQWKDRSTVLKRRSAGIFKMPRMNWEVTCGLPAESGAFCPYI